MAGQFMPTPPKAKGKAAKGKGGKPNPFAKGKVPAKGAKPMFGR